MFSSLPTLNQIKLSQRHARLRIEWRGYQRLPINSDEPYTITNEQYTKIVLDADSMSHMRRVELLEACERFNRMRLQDQVLKDMALFTSEQRFDIFMDEGMIVIQDEDEAVRYRLFDKSADIIKITQESL